MLMSQIAERQSGPTTIRDLFAGLREAIQFGWQSVLDLPAALFAIVVLAGLLSFVLGLLGFFEDEPPNLFPRWGRRHPRAARWGARVLLMIGIVVAGGLMGLAASHID